MLAKQLHWKSVVWGLNWEQQKVKEEKKGGILRVRTPPPRHRARVELVVSHEPVVDGPLLVAEAGVPRAEPLQAPGAEERRLHEHLCALLDVGHREEAVALEGRLSHRDVLVGVGAVGQWVAGDPTATQARVWPGAEVLVLPPSGGGGR